MASPGRPDLPGPLGLTARLAAPLSSQHARAWPGLFSAGSAHRQASSGTPLWHASQALVSAGAHEGGVESAGGHLSRLHWAQTGWVQAWPRLPYTYEHRERSVGLVQQDQPMECTEELLKGVNTLARQ
ncbi:hypothetical protein NDU88_005647 [Pleurodeles waltl]|uniref:Uncharacterized protein n=1 Tax=Pleurodeles waltl TaxID=8319 RepID=A0AAV7TBQ0_PLEWA|nr:hypothetical protein NDU88_005647 [Pleurodeles waltl]